MELNIHLQLTIPLTVYMVDRRGMTRLYGRLLNRSRAKAPRLPLNIRAMMGRKVSPEISLLLQRTHLLLRQH
nr:hypothetical protein Iba_chr06fCG9110 [Ipomoea batatas]